MCSKLSKNAVLQGYIDHYCLPCELLLRCEDEMERHCEKTLHQKNLGKCHYLDDFCDDRIRKVNKGYYCEFCNLYLYTLNKIKLHILDASHEFNKADKATPPPTKSAFLKRDNNAIVAFEDVLINDEAWNGLSGDTCLVCDVECDNLNIHRSESGHILKLITSNIQFGGDNSISRQIDPQTYQCLTCNILVRSGSLSAHFDSQEHKRKYLDSIIMLLKETKENDLNAAENKNTKSLKESENSDFKDLEVRDGGEIYPNLVPKSDRSENEVKENTGAIPKTSVKESPKNNEENIKVFAESNDVTYNGEFNQAYCRVCTTNIPSSMTRIKEHVNGKVHKSLSKNKSNVNSSSIIKEHDNNDGNIKKRSKNESKVNVKIETEEKYSTITFLQFTKTISKIETSNADYLVINKEILIDSRSYMICPVTDETDAYCGLCNRSFSALQLLIIHEQQHKRTHDRMLEKVPIVLLGDEFVREVRPGIFHCGYCNELILTWKPMEAHLRLPTHNDRKATARLLLEFYKNKAHVPYMFRRKC